MLSALGFDAGPARSDRSPLHAKATASPATVTAPVVQVLRRVGRVLGLRLVPLGARSQRQHNEERGEPSVPVHRFFWATRSAVPNPRQRKASIRLASLFLTLPTRRLTGSYLSGRGNGAGNGEPDGRSR
jgi:hypothetical protein